MKTKIKTKWYSIFWFTKIVKLNYNSANDQNNTAGIYTTSRAWRTLSFSPQISSWIQPKKINRVKNKSALQNSDGLPRLSIQLAFPYCKFVADDNMEWNGLVNNFVCVGLTAEQIISWPNHVHTGWHAATWGSSPSLHLAPTPCLSLILIPSSSSCTVAMR